MVKRFFNAINREVAGLHQAAYLLAFFAIASQVLALVRDRLLASYFGAGQTLDIYYASFRIPDFIFITVGSMVSVSVLIPFLVEKTKGGQEEGRKFIGNIFTFFFPLIVAVSLVAFFLVPSDNSDTFQRIQCRKHRKSNRFDENSSSCHRYCLAFQIFLEPLRKHISVSSFIHSARFYTISE